MIKHVEYFNLRDIWKNETSDFNKWLFEKENLSYLGNEVWIQLIPFKKEMKVNKGRIDILAMDKENDTYVLIENQIAKADHQHYGRIIDYIYCIKPAVTIWVVNEWKNFHKNTIKLIEDITALFVVKVELIRIGQSSFGIKFTKLIEPENWNRRKYFTQQKITTSIIKETKAISVDDSLKNAFFSWLDSYFGTNSKSYGVWIAKLNLISEWKKNPISIPFQATSTHLLFRVLKKYSIDKNLIFESKKSNSIEYYRFTPSHISKTTL